MNSQLRKVTFVVMAVCICTFLCTSRCLAGAWTMEEGKIYERLAVNHYFADKEFDHNGNKVGFELNGEWIDTNISNYIEYGLTNRFTLINTLYYKCIKKKDDFDNIKTNGIGDIDLGVRGKVSEASWGVLSTQALVKIPEAYDKDDKLPLGNGQYDTELRLLYGRSLWPYIPGYCGFEIGYRWRFGDPSDELRYLVEFGMDFTWKFYGRIKLDGIYSMHNGNQFAFSVNPTTTISFDLGKLDMALGYKITDVLGFEIAYAHELYGSNTTAGAAYTFAITYQTK